MIRASLAFADCPEPRRPLKHADRDAAESIFERARRGDAGVEELLTGYLPRLRAFVRAHFDADLRRRESYSDIVQSVCRGVLAGRRDVEFPSESAFRAWLFTAALNKIREKYRVHRYRKRDVARERHPDPRRTTELLCWGYASVCSPSELVAAEEQVDKLESALDRLPDHYREVIALARLAELPWDEVAARIGRTKGAAQQLLGRALLRLGREI